MTMMAKPLALPLCLLQPVHAAFALGAVLVVQQIFEGAHQRYNSQYQRQLLLPLQDPPRRSALVQRNAF